MGIDGNNLLLQGDMCYHLNYLYRIGVEWRKESSICLGDPGESFRDKEMLKAGA